MSRRRLFLGLAGLSSLAILTETDGASRIGVGQATAIDTADDESALQLSFEESNDALTIDSTLESAEVTEFDAEKITVGSNPTGETVPVTIEVETDGHDEDTVTARLEKEDIQVEAEQRLVLEGDG
ncbi:hypothetical protein C500_15090 [Natrialba magadii ATCC 43099]|uniref:Uncharacterized protein n=1 Tax=Natrialba magadii (strain ATCC 43099 / DSM 3394 / CCM 3739 / CIP 104546 / IAM 13178 / JCM 8861 / NBRC 102185 / NCIMB 2190 / MS3) TaxID=547559 RepID=L9UNS0_NATMM|nr:hypothetical protein C500_15090 [Natrialba magadii ATCC 43099]